MSWLPLFFRQRLSLELGMSLKRSRNSYRLLIEKFKTTDSKIIFNVASEAAASSLEKENQVYRGEERRAGVDLSGKFIKNPYNTSSPSARA
jgi:hypothetical protein